MITATGTATMPIKTRVYFTDETREKASIYESMQSAIHDLDEKAEVLADKLNDVKAEPMSASVFKRERSRHRALLYEANIARLKALEYLRQSLLPAIEADRRQAMKARQSDLDAIIQTKIKGFTALGATGRNDAENMVAQLPEVRKEQASINSLAYDDGGIKGHSLPSLIAATRQSVIELGQAL